MRLALRFAVAITIGVGAVLALQALLHVRRMAELQETEIRGDVLTLGRALSAAAGELWTLHGPDEAAAFIEQATARREDTTISLRPIEGSGETGVDAAQSRIRRRPSFEGWQVVMTAPVRSGGRTVGELEIERRLPSEKRYFESILWTQVGTTIGAAAVCGLIAMGVGIWVVGRPIRELSALAGRVAEGDYSLRSGIVQADEIGNLARDLNIMTQRLEESQEQVRAERRARTETLESLRHADRLATVGRLASSVAHELGTPLNIISGRADMIASDEEVPEEARQNARRIAEQAQRMTSIIEETLAFSRRTPVDKQDNAIRKVLEEAVSLLEPILEDRNIVVRTDGDRGIVAAIDEAKILQVLTNMVMNAIQAMPDGGTITLGVEREHVSEPVDRHAAGGDVVKLSIRDEGVGIAEDQLPHVFDAFATGRAEGTGLGLSVCQGIVREHGGWIEVDSEVGHGTRFRVYLPESEET